MVSDRVTTSAQKTVPMTAEEAMDRLRARIAEQESITFQPTRNAAIEAAPLGDGSVLHVAAFDRGDGRSVAMVDHRGVARSERARWQRHWRRSIDDIFE